MRRIFLFGGDRINIAELKSGELLKRLGSAEPTPGGGSVAALAGSAGAALSKMVSELTLAKTDGAHGVLLRSAAEKAGTLSEHFTELMTRDTEVFSALIAAYALPKDGEQQLRSRSAAIQTALCNCTQVPVMVMEACAEGMDLLDSLACAADIEVLSDLGIAAQMLSCAMRSAWLNVLINTAHIKDKTFVKESCLYGEKLLSCMLPLSQRCYERVEQSLLERQQMPAVQGRALRAR